MSCPYCEATGGINETHRHLVDVHLDKVETRVDEDAGKMYYLVPCPFCGLKYRRQVKPRRRDPGFLEAFRAEIALVAFDQLLYHVLQRHPGDVGVDPALLNIDPDDKTHFDA